MSWLDKYFNGVDVKAFYGDTFGGLMLGLGLGSSPTPVPTPILSVDFSSLSLGPATLPSGFVFARASDTTVQTSNATRIDTVGGSDIAAIGQRTSSSADRGLVVEPARTNVGYPSSIANAGEWGFVPGTATLTAGQSDPAGGTDASRMQLADGGYCGQLQPAGAPAGTYSFWHKNNNAASGLALYQTDGSSSGWQVGAEYVATWARSDKTLVANDGILFDTRGFVTPYYAPIDGTFDGFQIEAGNYPSELIKTTTTSATRAGGHLSRATSDIIDTNCLSLDSAFTAKGAISEGDATGYLWYLDANNNVAIDPTTNKISVTIGGSTYTYATPLFWRRYDKISLYVAAGGGAPRAIYSVARLGAIVDLGAGTSQGSLSAGTSDFFCHGTGNQLAAWIHQIKAWPKGTLPPWTTASQPTQYKQVRYIGDSITYGYGLSAGQAYPYQCNAIIGAAYGAAVNLGINGDTIVNIDGPTRKAQFEATYDAYAQNVGVVFAGTNDGATGTAETTALAALWNFCDTERAKGSKIVVVNCLPRIPTSVDQPTFDAWRAAYNSDIAAGWASHADGFADVAGDSRIGPNGANLNTTYYQADATHPNATGAGIIASILAPVIEGLA